MWQVKVGDFRPISRRISEIVQAVALLLVRLLQKDSRTSYAIIKMQLPYGTGRDRLPPTFNMEGTLCY